MCTQKDSAQFTHSESIDKLSKLAKKYAYSAPGYFAYPTFADSHNAQNVNAAELIYASRQESASIYIHIPFCRTLCFHCGCHEEVAQDRREAVEYIDRLIDEMVIYKPLLYNKRIERVHLGGGCPNFLSEHLIVKLISALYNHFTLTCDTVFSLEVDPLTTTAGQIVLFSKCGFSRISVGVQDFHDNVQRVINKVQSKEQIRSVIDTASAYGFNSINIDLFYGLPLQTVESVTENLQAAVAMDISRVTVTKYEHRPAIFPAQRELDKYPFPEENEQLMMFCNTKNFLQHHGYHLIGGDHFVLERDPLFLAVKEKRLLRNFLGYDIAYSADVLGLGVSSISHFAGSYFQNTQRRVDYYRATEQKKSPVAKVAIADRREKVTWSVIHNLLCYKQVDLQNVLTASHYQHHFQRELALLHDFEEDGLINITGSHFDVTNDGDIFLRNICSVFDVRTTNKQNFCRFSSAI
ncbi:oxygen-independent coproporphyrinogen III oxidase [Enterobacter sp. Bisph1]|uniref:oxygen-independent coproporphyrinogen III oxidase n=1 Tax=Enterobacter sp. Bisph1 TaxID=1274399 RepID=UPI00057BD991|nr:oxygen-independent coproporphyrinogen III oxidase [Enterobacter sp. Bisph1]